MARRMQACIPCHGREGRATAEGYFPRIAGKPAGYLFNQLVHFRDGRRVNAAMGYLVQHLSDDYLREIAEWFSRQELPYPPPAAVRGALPRMVEVGGERFRIVEVEGELIVHAATCPHWLGPLDDAEVIDGCIRCPWHAYVFDVRTGESRDGRGLTLATPPRLVLIEGQLALVPA